MLTALRRYAAGGKLVDGPCGEPEWLPAAEPDRPSPEGYKDLVARFHPGSSRRRVRGSSRDPAERELQGYLSVRDLRREHVLAVREAAIGRQLSKVVSKQELRSIQQSVGLWGVRARRATMHRAAAIEADNHRLARRGGRVRGLAARRLGAVLDCWADRGLRGRVLVWARAAGHAAAVAQLGALHRQVAGCHQSAERISQGARKASVQIVRRALGSRIERLAAAAVGAWRSGSAAAVLRGVAQSSCQRLQAEVRSSGLKSALATVSAANKAVVWRAVHAWYRNQADCTIEALQTLVASAGNVVYRHSAHAMRWALAGVVGLRRRAGMMPAVRNWIVRWALHAQAAAADATIEGVLSEQIELLKQLQEERRERADQEGEQAQMTAELELTLAEQLHLLRRLEVEQRGYSARAAEPDLSVKAPSIDDGANDALSASDLPTTDAASLEENPEAAATLIQQLSSLQQANAELTDELEKSKAEMFKNLLVSSTDEAHRAARNDEEHEETQLAAQTEHQKAMERLQHKLWETNAQLQSADEVHAKQLLSLQQANAELTDELEKSKAEMFKNLLVSSTDEAHRAARNDEEHEETQLAAQTEHQKAMERLQHKLWETNAQLQSADEVHAKQLLSLQQANAELTDELEKSKAEMFKNLLVSSTDEARHSTRDAQATELKLQLQVAQQNADALKQQANTLKQELTSSSRLAGIGRQVRLESKRGAVRLLLHGAVRAGRRRMARLVHSWYRNRSEHVGSRLAELRKITGAAECLVSRMTASAMFKAITGACRARQTVALMTSLNNFKSKWRVAKMQLCVDSVGGSLQGEFDELLGKLSKMPTELKIPAERPPDQSVDPDPNKLFDLIDTNHDGVISIEEFAAAQRNGMLPAGMASEANGRLRRYLEVREVSSRRVRAAVPGWPSQLSQRPLRDSCAVPSRVHDDAIRDSVHEWAHVEVARAESVHGRNF